jgi:hypothetical protein
VIHLLYVGLEIFLRPKKKLRLFARTQQSARSQRECDLPRESPVELAMRSDPEPDPFVTTSDCDCANISRDADRPRTRIKAQSFEAQTGMRRILAKELVCSARCGARVRR